MIVEKNKKIKVFTDGGARFKSKDGKVKPTDKCACAYSLEYNGTKKIGCFSGYGYTNNTMELQAILYALNNIKNKNITVELYSDSQYAINCVTKWAKNWERNNWKKKDGKEISNLELIKEIYYKIEEFPFLSFIHVKGHSGIKGNEEVDKLLNYAMDQLNNGKGFPVFQEEKYI